jgi:hypothetical protein
VKRNKWYSVDESLGNLIYLIPIALVIFRILSSLTGNRKRQAQREAEEAKRTAGQSPAIPAARQTASENEELRKFFKSFGVSEDETLPHWEREKKTQPAPVVRKTPKKPLVKKPVKEPQVLPKPALKNAPVSKKQETIAEPAKKRNFMPQRLSPLQQGLIWAEILGPPKSEA